MKTNTFRLTAAVFAAGLCSIFPAAAQQGDGTDVQYPVSIFKPNKVQPTAERVARPCRIRSFSMDLDARGHEDRELDDCDDEDGHDRRPIALMTNPRLPVGAAGMTIR